MSLCSLVLATTGKAAGRRPCRTELVQANHGEAEGGSRAGGEEDSRDAISGEKAKQRRLGHAPELTSSWSSRELGRGSDTMDEGSRNSGRRPSAGEGPRWATRPWQGGHENLLKEEGTSLRHLRACGRATRQGTERSVVAG